MAYGNPVNPLSLYQYMVTKNDAMASEYVSGKSVSCVKGEIADRTAKTRIPVKLLTTKKMINADTKYEKYINECLFIAFSSNFSLL